MGMMDMLRKADAYLSEPLEDGQPRSLIYSGLKDSVANLGEIAKQFNDGNGYMVGGTVVPVDPQRISQAVMDWGAVASPVGGMMTPAGSLGTFGGKAAKFANEDDFIDHWDDYVGYFRARSPNQPLQSSWGHSMFAKGSPERIWPQYGEKLYFLPENIDLPNIEDFRKDIIKQWSKDYKKGLLPPEIYDYGVTGKQIADSANPVDIVDSADAWDDAATFSWLYENVLGPRGVGGVKTDDGLILFDNDYATRLLDSTSAPAPIQAMQRGDTKGDTQPLVYGRDYI